MNPIDLMVGLYNVGNVEAEACMSKFLISLYDKCNLDQVNVFCVERSFQPITTGMRSMINRFGFLIKTCPLPQLENCREDTSEFCNWMAANCGNSPWFCVAHFDIIFTGDYIGFARTLMQIADMVGNHCDGLVLIKRVAYEKCGVGFFGLDGLGLYPAGNQLRLLPSNNPYREDMRQCILQIDVGELLALRMNTLSLKHIHLFNRNGVGKCDYFVHTRCGSGHSGIGQSDGDKQPHIY